MAGAAHAKGHSGRAPASLRRSTPRGARGASPAGRGCWGGGRSGCAGGGGCCAAAAGPRRCGRPCPQPPLPRAGGRCWGTAGARATRSRRRRRRSPLPPASSTGGSRRTRSARCRRRFSPCLGSRTGPDPCTASSSRSLLPSRSNSLAGSLLPGG